MRKLVILLLVTFLLKVFCTESAVIVGTSANFEDLIEENDFVLVEFYAPWCGHCKQLEPEYENAAAQLKSENSKVVLVKVDATAEQELAQNYDIKGYPTIYFFKNGEKFEYDGPRQAEGIISWLKKKSGPASTLLKADEVESFKAKGYAVVGVFKNEDSKSYNSYMNVAKNIDDFSFGHIFNPDSVESVTITTSDKVEIKFDKEKITKKDLKEWINKEGYPTLVELDQKVWSRSNANKMSLLVGFIDKENEDHLKILRDLGKENKGKLITTFMDSEENGQLAQRWGASGTKFPTAVVVNYQTENPKLYIWNEETETDFNLESVSTFVRESIEGTYKNFQKSEPIPEKNSDPVKVVVGKSFNDIVMDTTKDVLLEFYAPWCGHCQKLVPTYEELAKKFGKYPNLVIAKMDATANAYPEEIVVSGFPTIYLPCR